MGYHVRSGAKKWDFVFQYKSKNDNSEFPSKYFVFQFRICLRYIFHNLLNDDNLGVHRAHNQKNSELKFLCIAQETIARKSEFFNDV